MEVHLPPDLQQFIDDQVHRGVFPSANEAVCRAVQTFRESEAERDRQRAEILREIDKGLEQIERGEARPLDIEWIKAEGRRRLAEQRQLK